ncbi:MAG: glycosyltransferase family 9 protein [Bryobacteraceae bacterium]
MSGKAIDGSPHILIVRLGAMGDIIHTLPAVASLKQSHPRSRVTWVIDAKWLELMEGNPFVDTVIPVRRHTFSDWLDAQRRLRDLHPDIAIDFQGLIKSAVVAAFARPDRIYGFHYSLLREKAAAVFYSKTARTQAPHVVDRNLELAAAAGAANILHAFPLPAGKPEGELPAQPFVLANPLAGWASKQWPLEYYAQLARRLQEELGLALVLNGAPASRAALETIAGVSVHCSGIAGLISATRQARAIVGLDSGPLHIAAALRKPGVAIFGPTDPTRNGPYGDTIAVLRDPNAHTTYKRRTLTDDSMNSITPNAVFDALKARLNLGAA